ncbi:MAG: phosphoglycolate phosphatase [Steroidobacteraceae bacterium]
MNARRAANQPRWRGHAVHAVLFDLDGTLLDTVDDIALALNRALGEKQFDTLTTAQVRNLIGRGVPTLITRAIARLGVPVDPAARASLLERFYFHYGRLHMLDECNASVYPGVTDGLGALHRLGLRLAVVTNKQKHFAVDLLNRLGLSDWIDVVVGGDSCERRKPDPQPLQFACATLRVEPSEALMVGDSVNDVLAARAARLPVVCVPYGYNEGSDPRELPCDAFIETVADLPALLLGEAPALNSLTQPA